MFHLVGVCIIGGKIDLCEIKKGVILFIIPFLLPFKMGKNDLFIFIYTIKNKEDMKKSDKKLCNFWLPNDIYEYLKLKSKDNYMSMTDYVIQMLLNKKNLDKNV